MTKVLIRIPTSYFPPLIQLALLTSEEIDIILEAQETYQKRSERNRCSLLSSAGKSTLSVPLRKGKNANTSIQNVKISYESDWVTQHKKAILYYYQNAPFFEYYIDRVNVLLDNKYERLYDLNKASLDFLKESMFIEKPTIYSTEYRKNNLDVIHAYQKELIIKDQLKYNQVYDDKLNFTTGLSGLDLLFNRGPESKLILESYGNDFIHWYRHKSI